MTVSNKKVTITKEAHYNQGWTTISIWFTIPKI